MLHPLPEKPTLADFQRFIGELVAEKKWSTDRNEIFVLLTEEVGELAKEVRRSWKAGDASVPATMPGEFADIFMYLLDLANAYGIDLEQAVRNKIAFNESRKEFGH